jgi:hypothetical protein
MKYTVVLNIDFKDGVKSLRFENVQKSYIERFLCKKCKEGNRHALEKFLKNPKTKATKDSDIELEKVMKKLAKNKLLEVNITKMEKIKPIFEIRFTVNDVKITDKETVIELNVKSLGTVDIIPIGLNTGKYEFKKSTFRLSNYDLETLDQRIINKKNALKIALEEFPGLEDYIS